MTKEQMQALAIVENLLDDLGLTSTKISLIEDIEEELAAREIEEEYEVEELAELYGIAEDDFYFGQSAEEFISEMFGI